MCERPAQQSGLKAPYGCKGGCAGLANFLKKYVKAKRDNKRRAGSIWERVNSTTLYILGRVI